MPFDPSEPETRPADTLRSFWKRYCPKHRTGGNAGSPVIVERKVGRSKAAKARKAQRIRCDQCEALMINGLFCHETGCPNTHSRYDAETGEWIKQRKCFECGYTVDLDEPCCNAEVQ